MIACVAMLSLFADMQHAQAQFRLKRLSFDDLVKKSDVIFVASCEERETLYRHGNFVTRYLLKPSEFIKGQAKLSKAGRLEFEEIGGTIHSPLPMKQHYPGMADIGEGEEVLLFTGYKRLDREKTGLNHVEPVIPHGMLRIVGGDSGHHRVVRHPETGEKMLGRKSLKLLQVAAFNRAAAVSLEVNAADKSKEPGIKSSGKLSGSGEDTKIILPGSEDDGRLQSRRKLARSIDRIRQKEGLRGQIAKGRGGSPGKWRRGTRVRPLISQFESLSSVKSRIKAVR